MIELQTLECGSLPKEVFDACRVGYSVYLTPCKYCGKTLISIDSQSERDQDQEGFRTFAYFRCECGAKLKRLALDLASSKRKSGFFCKQGVISPLFRKGRHNAKDAFNADAYAIDFFSSSSMTRHRYIVMEDAIKLK